MRILYIAQGESPHTIRAFALVKTFRPDAEIDLFPDTPFGCSQEAATIARCYANGSKPPLMSDFYWNDLFLKPVTPYSPNPALLAEVLRQNQYDFIHVFGMQEGAYLLRKALDEPNTTTKGATVIYSLWGSDLYYFGNIPEHRDEILKALKHCNKLHPDTERDGHLARGLGYTGEIVPVISIVANAALLQNRVDQIAPARKPPSQRTRIIVRGTYPVRGRGFMAVNAYQRLPIALKKKYLMALMTAAPIDEAAAYRVTDSAPVMIARNAIDYNALMMLYSEARLLVSINITDGTPQTYWESAATGVYPIFSQDTGLKPLIRDKNLRLVDPDDISQITQAMEEALVDDAMVDAAVEQNHSILHKVQSNEQLEHLIQTLYS